jgi:hypothetical protein
MTPARKERDAANEAALWTAVRMLDEGNRRPVPEVSGTIQRGGPSWHERDTRRIMFLRHRYTQGEWQGEADRWRPEHLQP